ncbi:hypothetical protein E1200_08040 [Actinomadura sp. GC306]|uniref:hypothetical protein n=1 Tax=Actinomadura sp. GC306 TaxID=2530367 RepID=UPI0010537ABD|nr:hypothetical protein [Actinomadura sp. GC306]TDC69568.1 hypothetical protein E1200_08040 [Actinomadura sp. GC306]
MANDDRRPSEKVRRTADILFMARVKAAEMRFEVVPENAVVFTGDADEESASGSDRTNLPRPVRENVTYRDVQIDYAIAAKLQQPDSPGDDLQSG